MNIQQQPHSNNKRNDDGIYEKMPRPITTGTEFKQMNFNHTIRHPSNLDAFLIPLYNLLALTHIDRTGTQIQKPTRIFIHRIEFEYIMIASPQSTVLPERNSSPSVGYGSHFRPSIRILILHPKTLIQGIPSSSPLDTGTFPYYSNTGNINHPIAVPRPILTQSNNRVNGLLGLPDPKLYDVVYDDVKNTHHNSIVPFSTGSFTFTIREEVTLFQPSVITFAYPMPEELINKIPQIWFFSDQNGELDQTPPIYEFYGHLRIIYDDVQ